MVYDVETGKYFENDMNKELIPDIKEQSSLEDRVSALEDVMLESILGGLENA